MSYYSGPEELAANPPETWRVQKLGKARRWALLIVRQDYQPFMTFASQRAAEAERDNPDSYTRRAVERERLWYEGVTPTGWKTWEQCRSERRRTA